MDRRFMAELIAEEIAPGKVVHAERQTGKTEALLQVIHEKHRGDAWLVAIDQNLAYLLEARYRERYPEDQIPHICSSHNVTFAILGNNDPIYCDEWWMFPLEAQRKLKECEYRIAGAVGTVPAVCVFPL